MLDQFASTFASEFNKLNVKQDADGNITDRYPLFTNGTDLTTDTVITAANIQLSADWLSGKTQIVATQKPDILTDGATSSTANENILQMIQLLEKKVPSLGPDAGGSSFYSFYNGMVTQLNEDISFHTSTLENYVSVADNLASSRDNISAVSLDEEGINILQYQKSFNAASRLMTALDEALDTVINNMGVVGR